MTLEEMVTAIVDRTKRVDKRVEIRQAVRKAIRLVHTAGYFVRDIVEEEVDLGGTHHQFKIPLPPRVRKFITVSPLNSSGQPIAITTDDNTYDGVSSTDIISSFFERKYDIYYVAGAVLTVKSTVGASKLYVSFYAYPEVADNNLETWLMRDNESIFIDAALMDFYNLIGRQAMSNDSRNQMMLQLSSVIEDNVDIVE
jgi:hypothetical protein